ncbi:MAG: hypothetical protein HYY17_13625 [Planctomycetes bacterium]|nr:hypothetical protein [Planctomycetota bacterium]
MRISMEIFSVPEEAVEPLRRAVYESFEKFLYRNNSRECDTNLGIRGGTCPLSGRAYLCVVVQSADPVDLHSLNLFADSVYAAHPLRDEEVVRKNRFVRIEDGAPTRGGNGLPDEDDDEVDEEMACWVCGRFDGEEYRDFASGVAASLDVQLDPTAGVPLCTVCAKILNRISH